MGEVFLGSSPGGRDVVVKLIRSEFAGQPKFRRRFVREVEAAQRVGGFHTAQVVEARPEEDPPWMVTEYIRGPSLRDLVLAGGALPVERVWPLAAQLCEGLAAIHACGLVHRDIKPANVIMASDGPRIIDFGIARMADASVLTDDGAVVGTYAFMSPEQVQARKVGPASDVFSLGGVLVFAATGRTPFEAPSLPAIVYRIGSTEPDLDGVGTRLRELVAACLAKRPEERPSTTELLERLADSTVGGVPFSAPVADRRPLTTVPPPAGSAPRAAGPEPRSEGAVPGLFGAGQGPSGAESRSSGGGVDEEPTRPPGVRRRRVLLAGVGAAAAAAVPVGVVLSRRDTRAPGSAFEGPLVGHGTGVHGVSFTPDGEHVVSGDAWGTIIVWDTSTGEQVRKLPKRHTHRVLPPWFSADGRTMITSAENTFVWDFAAGRTIRAIATEEVWTQAPELSVALSPDGRLLATNGGAGAVLWDVATGKRIRTLEDLSSVRSVAFSPDGRTLVTRTGGRPYIRVWSLPNDSNRIFRDVSYVPFRVLISPDGTKVAVSSLSRPPGLWDLATGKMIGLFDVGRPRIPSSGAIAFSPDGKLLAAVVDVYGPAEGPAHIWLWDVETRRNVRTIERGHTARINSVAFSPSGRTLATASEDRTVHLWNLT